MLMGVQFIWTQAVLTVLSSTVSAYEQDGPYLPCSVQQLHSSHLQHNLLPSMRVPSLHALVFLQKNLFFVTCLPVQFSRHFRIITHWRIHTSMFTALIQLTSLRLPVELNLPNEWWSLRNAGYIYQTAFQRVILEAIYAPNEVWGRDQMPMETSYKNSVSLRQRSLKQFNVSVLEIPTDIPNTVFHNSKEMCTAIQCFPCRNFTGYSVLIKFPNVFSTQKSLGHSIIFIVHVFFFCSTYQKCIKVVIACISIATMINTQKILASVGIELHYCYTYIVYCSTTIQHYSFSLQSCTF